MLNQRDLQPPRDAREPAQDSASDSEPPDAAEVKRQEIDNRFKELFDRHYDRTVVFLGRMGIPREEARELAQETFLRVYQSMQKSPIANERAFIQTAARWLGLNHVRDNKAGKRRADVVSLEGSPSAADAAASSRWTHRPPLSQEEELIAREEESRRRRRLRDAIERLPETLRQPLLLQLGGFSQREIQAALRLTPNAVKSRLRDARRKLRRWLGEEPVGIEGPGDLPEDSRDRES